MSYCPRLTLKLGFLKFVWRPIKAVLTAVVKGLVSSSKLLISMPKATWNMIQNSSWKVNDISSRWRHNGWARWRLKSPAWRLFTQPFIRAQIKENTKAPRHWPLCREFTGAGEFPAQMASNAENVSIFMTSSCDTGTQSITGPVSGKLNGRLFCENVSTNC